MVINFEEGLVDTNILVYAYHRSSEHHLVAKNFLEDLLGRQIPFLSIQNLIEFYSIVTNHKRVDSPLTQKESKQKLDQIINGGFYRIVSPLKTTPNTLTTLLSKISVTATDIFDLHLAATMIDNGINTIYTADTTIFKKAGLKAINPLK